MQFRRGKAGLERASCVAVLLFFSAAGAVAELPAVFDLRDYNGHSYVTAIRDQGPYGTCWTFGLLASPESNLLMTGNWGPNGVEMGEPNLAERHLDWWSGFNQFNNDDVDPPTGNGTQIHAGGNSIYLTAYMSRGDGMVRELDAPYRDIDFPPPRSHRRFHRYYARDIDMYVLADDLSNIDVIKQNVMAKGAVSTCMFTDSKYFTTINGRKVHYQPPHTSEFINHEIAIIGWDDNMPTPAPQGPGAWLIKNSWGTGWNPEEGGFFWISYYDKFAGRYPTFDGGTISIHNVHMLTGERFYYHDYHGWVDTKTDSNLAFNAFVATADELIIGVNFYTAVDNVSFTARIYDRFEGGELLDMRGELTGFKEYRGFHTADFDTPVPLTAGDDFYVYLEVSDGGQAYDRTFDSTAQAMPGGGPVRAIVDSTAAPGQSFYWDGSAWQDLYYFEDPNWTLPCQGTTNFCMKAIVVTDCNGNGVSDVLDIQAGLSLDVNGNWLPDECEPHYVVYVDDDAPLDPGPGDPTVSDPNEDGTLAHPFDSIQKALDSLGPLLGNNEIVEVILLDGVYTGPGNRDVEFYSYDYDGYRNIIVRSQNGPQNCRVDVEYDYSYMGTAFMFGGDGTAEPVLEGLTIENAPNAAVYCGGYASTIRNCVLSWNGTAVVGNPQSCPTLEGCDIANNFMGVFAYSQSPAIIDCRIFDNEGAGVFGQSSTIVVRNSSFSGNYGAGVDLVGGQIAIANSVVEGNTSTGIRLYGAQASIHNCTVVNNLSDNFGGGVYAGGYTDPIYIDIVNCILWGNQGLQDTQVAVNSVGVLVLDLAYSNVEYGQAGVKALGQSQLNWGLGNIALDALFVAPGNHHLRPTSPCVDAGAPTAYYANQRDLDGDPRAWDGNGDGTARADIGADEFVRVPGDLNCDGVIDAADINPFVAALSWPPRYLAEFTACNLYNADVNGDNQIDLGDINPFVALLTGQ